MHDLGGKQVEVKSATPKGSGPQSGRGAGPPVPGRGGGAFGRGPYPAAGRGGAFFSQAAGAGYGAGFGAAGAGCPACRPCACGVWKETQQQLCCTCTLRSMQA